MAYELLLDKTTELGKTYDYEAFKTVFDFQVNLPEQLAAEQVANHYINGAVDSLTDQGSELLRTRVWIDRTSGVFTTNFRAELTATGQASDATNISGQSQDGIALHVIVYVVAAVIILAILAVIGFYAWHTVESIENIVQYVADKMPYLGIGIALMAAGLGIMLLKRAVT